MGFITLALSTGAKAQLSDSKLTLKRLFDIIGITLRRTDLAETSSVEYQDEEADWVRVGCDEDVAELYRVGKAMAPALLQIRLQPCGDAVPSMSTPVVSKPTVTASVPLPSSFLAPAAPKPTATSPDLWDSTLNFFVNGLPVSITNPDPTVFLVEYLRDVLQLKGTKIGCGEGGCGACTVVLSWQDQKTGGTVYESVNSCLRPLCAMDGLNVITAEGIGSRLKGYHPVQSALAKANGSQCGFCSVGWTMQAYKMLEDNPKPLGWQVDNSFDGNLCRCTGIFPILNAYKTFSPDVPKPLSGGCCGGSGGCGTAKEGSCAPTSSSSPLAAAGGCGGPAAPEAPPVVPPPMPLPEPLKRWVRVPKHFRSVRPSLFGASPPSAAPSVEWFSPTTLADLVALQAQFRTAEPGTVKYVCGNTAYGVEKYYNSPQYPTAYTVFIDVTQVPDLTAVTVAPSGLTVGGSITLAQLIDLCAQQDPMSPTYTNDPTTETVTTATSSYSALARHLLLVATRQVRAVGSWAGNLMLASHYHDFPSDVALVLMSLGCTVQVIQSGSAMTIPIEQVYAAAVLNKPTTLVVSMTIPNLQGVTAATPGPYIIDTFKTMLRHQNSHALCNAAFTLTLGAGGVVSEARIFFGGVSQQLFRATRTEAAIVGNTLNQAALTVAQSALTQDITNIGPSTYYGTTDAYRRQLAAAMLYKLFVRSQASGSVPAPLASAGLRYVRPLSSESSTYTSDPSEAPVSDPIMKLGALKQVSGEAQYTFDEKQDRDGLYGALAITQVSAGVITEIDTSAAAAMPGVFRVLTVADIPAGGKNDIGAVPGQEKMFLSVGDNIVCIGQSVALVLADTFEHALAASRAVVITASAPAAPPIFTIQQAIASGSLYPNGTPGRLVPPQGIVKGDVDAALKASATVVSGTVTVGAQKHFYMEVQNAVARLQEDDTLVVGASTQSPGLCQMIAGNITGLVSNQINIVTRRVGGGYGGKGSRMAPVVAASSLAAYVTGRQVHVQLERCQDFVMTGGREDLYAEYEVGVNEAGLIQGMKVTWYTNGGAFMDNAYGDLDMLMFWADTVYFFPTYLVQGFVCKTNLPATTSVRAPGVPQSIFVMETIMDQLAQTLKMDTNALRAANFLAVGETTTYGQPIDYLSLPTVWQQTLDQSEYTEVKATVDAFNAANRWRKRGISIMPVKYGIAWGGYNAEAIIRIYAADGTVQVSTSGCEIGQGLYTKVAQAVAYKLGIDLSLITVVPTKSDSTPANSGTGGSGTSEASVQAALNACDVINTRLAPVKAANPKATWPQLVSAASSMAIDLLAEGWFSPTSTPTGNVFQYFVYAAATSVVEIDVLTGELEILSTEMVYDCGESLNPLIDVGQIEGAYVMGLGLFLTEDVAFDGTTGELLSVGTFEYKPPYSLDIPQTMNVTLLPDCPNPIGILSSKATGEPPLSLAASVHLAIKYAVRAARADAGSTDDFYLPAPATPCEIATSCLTTTAMMTLS